MSKLPHTLTTGELRKLYGLVIVTALNNQNMNLRRHIYKCWWLIRTLFHTCYLSCDGTDQGSVAIIQQRLLRDDLTDTFDITKFVSSSRKYIIKRKFSMRFLYTIRTLLFFLKFYNNTNKLLTVFAIIDLMKILQNREFQKLNFQLFIFLNEKQYYEGLYAIAVQKHKLRALSVCHGFYRDTGKKISIDNTNVNNYSNLICREQVTFGQIQSTIIQKNYHQNVNCYSVGKPLLKKSKVSNNTESILDKSIPIILILDTKELQIMNIEMVKFLKKDCVKFKIKQHPDDKHEYDCKKINEIDVNAGSKFTIYGSNSTLVLQLARIGADVFLYNKSDFLKYIPEKHLERGENFTKVVNYNWRDFICHIGDDYYKELFEVLKLKC